MEFPKQVLLEARGLEVRRAGQPTLSALDLELCRGEAVALLGPNGAGKSTALAALAGVLPVAAGRVTVAGRDLTRADRRRLGYLPERNPLYPEMSPREHLVFCARLFGARPAPARRSADAALARCDLEAVADQEAHIREAHEDLCKADQSNLERFAAVLEMLGSKVPRA